MTTNAKITSSDEKNNDYEPKLVLIAGVLLLGAIFVMNSSGLSVFADVEPNMVDNSTDGSGPVHPGDVLLVNKNVTMNTTITPFFNVTWTVYEEDEDTECLDALNQPVLTLTTTNQTKFLNEGNHSKSIFFEEIFVGMPGVYHCKVVFKAVNSTDAGNVEFLGNQTVWIDGIGSKGYWKNHPNATELHLPMTLGNYNGGFEVGDNQTATELFKKHKGKFVLDRLAGQLLAAELNIWAIDNATKTGCIDGNVTEAHTILTDQEWDGPEKGNNLNKGQRGPALEVHGWLDTFNNFGCPLED